MIRKRQLLINYDSQDFNSLGRTKRQSINVDINIVMNGFLGWENQDFSFSKVKLEVVEMTGTAECNQRSNSF